MRRPQRTPHARLAAGLLVAWLAVPGCDSGPPKPVAPAATPLTADSKPPLEKVRGKGKAQPDMSAREYRDFRRQQKEAEAKAKGEK